MSKSRKTINIEDLRASANHYLAAVSLYEREGSTDQQFRREGVASLLEHALTVTGNYKGYRHLDAKFENGDIVNGDPTRRYYY